MDQRTESERREDATPNPQAKSAHAQGRKHPPWINTLRARRGGVLTLTAIAVVALIGLVAWWFNAGQYESTDDAFIDARTVAISSQVNAAIIDVPVTDNQWVEEGTALVRLDERDFKAQLDQAKAQVAQSAANVANIEAQLAAQQARIDQANKQTAQAQATLTFAQQQDERYQRLVKSGATTVEQAQQYASSLLQAQAGFAAAQANAVATEKQLPILYAQRKLADAQLQQTHAAEELAEANFSRTILTAPAAGRVTRLTAAKGAYASVGQALMMFVPRQVWVTANFKETQLDTMRPGDAVDIRIDAYPGHTFKGHVDSIQAGSGTAFSLLPAENATGNYVKIVQRVPVKIVFDQPPEVLLGPGISAVPSVKVR